MGLAIVYLVVASGDGLVNDDDIAMGESAAGVVTKRPRESGPKVEREDLRTDFQDLRDKGLSDEEIRWISEDFIAENLEEDYQGEMNAEGYRAQRERRGRWFLGAMREAFLLGEEQVKEAQVAMRTIENAALRDFMEYLDGVQSFTVDGKSYQVISGPNYYRYVKVSEWLDDERYAVWNLCNLTEEQLQLTWEHELSEERVDAGSKVGKEGNALERRVRQKLITNDFLVQGGVEVGSGEFGVDRVFPMEIIGFHVPFGSQQLERIQTAHKNQDVIAKLRCFTASQLKILFLLRPELAFEFRKAEVEATSVGR